MEFCESMWDGASNSNIRQRSGPCMIAGAESNPEDKPKSPEKNEDSHTSRSTSEKIQRRLAQNRQAAKRSRMKKKAYVQDLEMAWSKLSQLQLDLKKGRQHGLVIAGESSNAGILYRTVNTGISAFEMAFGHWKDGRERVISDLRNVLQCYRSEAELRLAVQNVLNQYRYLFCMKRDAARIDSFYLVSGMWRTSVERFFLWIGGFRPSEILSVVKPHLEPLTEQQIAGVYNLTLSCTQAEDALSQGVEKLRQAVAESIACVARGAGNYSSHTASALNNLESLEDFVQQADHLREQTLLRMSCILTARQAAKGLLAFGEYFQYLHALSEVWAARKPQ